MPLQATSGAASYDAFGGGVPVSINYIEDVFSCFLYTGTSASRSISNGIDLSTKGGLVWSKDRGGAGDNVLIDTVRGASKQLVSNVFDEQFTTSPSSISSFNTTGYSLPASTNGSDINYLASTYVSWTFRKQPKFFDVVTYTGTGANTTISHSLGSVPSSIWVKRTDTTGNWQVYHRSLANTEYLVLNSTAAKATGATRWNSTTPTSTVFSLGTDATVNASGGTYVAYLFAHDAGGFGLTGTDNVISCGSYSGNGSTQEINLGFEPQWILLKRATGGTSNWIIFDTMRGMSLTDANLLYPNASDAEAVAGQQLLSPTATGFSVNVNGTWYNASGSTYIYIAIRRGPMKVPTDATKVFIPVAQTAGGTVTTNFPVDLSLLTYRNYAYNKLAMDRLRGGTTNSYNYLMTESNSAETNDTGFGIGFDNNNAIVDTGFLTSPSYNGIYWNFRRAPSFFDEVCYTGTGSARTLTHNLGVVPELMIVKRRSASANWAVYSAALGATFGGNLNLNNAFTSAFIDFWNDTTPTSSVFSVGTDGETNLNGQTYVAYLFATCAGVSKIGSYTGTATTLQVDCGFTGGARFVLIKKTSGTGSWYVWDSARGIVSGNDPYLLLNSTAAEVTNTDYIDTYSAGFEISSTAPSEINENGGSFIFLAIA